MSVPPSSASFMAQATRNGTPELETFHKFFECWLVEQDLHLQQLISASKSSDDNPNGGATTESTQQQLSEARGGLRPLIDQVVQHYEQYYRAKSRWAKEDVLGMLSPSWRSTLEDAFLWIGGWRPSMAFHLLYSKSGLQLEARLADLIRGLSTGDLGDISPTQLVQIDELQRRTVREEKKITEKLAKHQETVADSSMVELSIAVSEMLRSGSGRGGNMGAGDEMDQRVESTLAPKEEGLEDLLNTADELRLRTLKGVVDILTPKQAVHFLIAAAELHLRLHEWGKKKDAMNNRYHHAPGGDAPTITTQPDQPR